MDRVIEMRLEALSKALTCEVFGCQDCSHIIQMTTPELIQAVRLSLPVLEALSANGSGDYAVMMADDALEKIGYSLPLSKGGES